LFVVATARGFDFRGEPTMKKSILCLAADGLAVLCLFAHGATAKTDSLTTGQRIQRVFPFQVGQQYEFQSGVTFHRPTGQALPPYTIAQITITDTVIDGKTYLHIPYWSSFGTEYYRLDDSLRIRNYNPDSSKEEVFLNLGYGGTLMFPGMGFECLGTCRMSGYSRSGSFTGIDKPFHLAYWVYYDNPSYTKLTVAYQAWTTASRTTTETGITTDADSALAYGFDLCCESTSVTNIFGVGGDGSVQHRQGVTDRQRRLAVFRPVSNEPWLPLANAMGDYADVRTENNRPSQFSVSAYPNPFNTNTLVRYSVPTTGHVTLTIYTIEGRLVRTLVDAVIVAGTHEAQWDGRGNDGKEAGGGVYVVRLVTPTNAVVERISLIR